MQLLQLLSFFLVVVLVTCEEDSIEDIERKCRTENSVTEDQVEKFDPENDADNTNLQCFMKCFFEKMGVISEDGKIAVKELQKAQDESKEASAIDKISEEEFKCLAEVPKISECKDILNMMKCVDASKFSRK